MDRLEWNIYSLFLGQTVFSEGSAIKLKAIIQDEGMRNPESSNNTLPDKPFDIYIPDISQRFSFDPFAEIICPNEQILFISFCFGETIYNIQTSLSKRPRGGKRIENSSRLVNALRKSLTLITFPNIFLCLFLHVWPPVLLSNGPVR